MNLKKPAGKSKDRSAVKKRAAATRPQSKVFPIVGIGASAGGLEAFRQLLERLPLDTGMAFVLVTHLDPKHESILPELLAKATQLPVSEVKDGTPVAPDHVYVLPRNASLAIEGGALRLRPREEGRGLRHPIDAFLQTLAEDQGARAVGVILSGTATDGTLGLEAVKAEGGITFAQEPKSAKYDSMPRSAVAAGCVDFTLSPEGIAEELARISRHPYVTPAEIAEPGAEETGRPADKEGFNKILALLRRVTGADFSLYKTNTLRRRIRRRMILNKLEGLDEYAKYLRDNPAEVENLYQDILINVTSFFRDPEAFEVLKEKIFPRIVEHRAPDEPVRIWAVGCSTGEEAYSIAMAFTEFAGERSGHIPVQIFATDLNQKGVEKARAGLYPKNIAEDVSPERLRRFFTEADGGYRISKPLRDMCVFARQNVVADPPFSRMDLISCRNLLIYLEPVLQKQVLPLLHYALKPAGVLWLGSSETTGAASDLFEPEDKKHRFYTKKSATGRPRFSYPTGDQTREKSASRRRPAARAERPLTSDETEARREADRIIAVRYAPASALINEEMDVLQLRGDTSPYLDQSPRKATRNLLKMAREGLVIALREAVDKAREDESPVRKENLRVKYDGATGDVNLEVIPLKHSPSQERHFLTLFETAEAADQGGDRKAGGGRRKSEERQIKQLHQELAASRLHLQSVVEEYEATTEELQSASEEAQSSNEELQSINEELETSKEELESSNEELITLNEELNNRNAELGRLNSDLVNLLGSVQMPILMLDGQLRIRRFTPAAEKMLKLIPTNVGRPIGDLKLNLDFPDLKRLIAEAIDTVSVKEVETRDGEGRWHSLRVRPYKTLENKIEGAVVVLVDIDALKKTEREIKAARDYAEAILRTTRDPLVVLRADLTVDSANEAFYKTFKLKPAETEGRSIYELSGRQWDIPRLRQLLEEVIPRDSFFNDFEITHEIPDLGARAMLLNARRLDNPESGPKRILLGAEDVTERKEEETARARLAAIVESSDDAIIAISLDGVIASWNQGAERLYGYTAQEAVGQPVTTLIPPERFGEEESMLERLRRGERIKHFETTRRRKDGSAVPISLTTSPVKNSQGEVIGASKIARDITERKRAEAALRQSEERFRRLLETLPVGAYTCDAEGLITYFNECAVEAWGRTPKLNDPVERFCGSYRLYSSDGAQIPHGECWMALALKENKVYEGREIMIERPDGSRLTVLAHVTPFYNEAGKLLGAVNIVVDITDRKQAEAVMAQMAAIVESSDDAIVSKDLNGIITSWNKGAQKLFGYTAEEVIGKSITILIPPDRENEDSYILDRIRRGEGVDHYETVRRRKDDSEIDVSLTVSPVRDKTGKVIGASKIARDISERKRLEIEREEMLLKETAARAEAESARAEAESARAEAEAANHSKDEFLAVVSHELRAPLSAILGYNRLLREKTPDAARLKSCCDVIERNAKTQLQLIEDLLDSARIASGKLRLESRLLDVNSVIADALDMMRPAAEAKGVRLLRAAEEDGSWREESATPNPQPAIVRGDAARLQQIIWNLLSNAIKFTTAGGRVELRAERAEGHIRIIVSDTGNGIPLEFLPYVFDRFRQADPSGSQRYGGLGLGLALVKHLVELHGGKVEAASEGAGHGSTFIVTLPLATQSELVAVEPQALALAAGANGEAQTRGAISLPAGVTIAGLRLLVVDDQGDALALLADFLGLYGAEVMTASSGAEALAILSNPPGDARPDILICDLAMPMEDGYTALRRMRALEEARGVAASQRIPAVALTALTGNEERLRALSSGFQAHVAKPADPVELILVIDNIAGIWRRKADSN